MLAIDQRQKYRDLDNQDRDVAREWICWLCLISYYVFWGWPHTRSFSIHWSVLLVIIWVFAAYLQKQSVLKFAADEQKSPRLTELVFFTLLGGFIATVGIAEASIFFAIDFPRRGAIIVVVMISTLVACRKLKHNNLWRHNLVIVIIPWAELLGRFCQPWSTSKFRNWSYTFDNCAFFSLVASVGVVTFLWMRETQAAIVDQVS